MTRVARWIVGLAVVAVIVGFAVVKLTDDPEPATNDLTVQSLGIDWPTAEGVLDVGDPPALPDGFDQSRYDRMVEALTAWATASTVDPAVRESGDPVADVAKELPDAVGRELATESEKAVAPRLAAANVFGPGVTVTGLPSVTSAWKVASEPNQGEPALTLELQTRAAYPVQVGDGPPRVIGMLRTHRLISREGEKGGIGVGFAWQEFGASNCALAVDDVLRPDSDPADARDDLGQFVEIGDGDDVVMPDLDADEIVDDEYLKRCQAGAT